MEVLQSFVDLFLHLDKHLHEWAVYFGPWLYVVLFAVIFCETGLVVTPFLPGDSLLFAVGALTATGTLGLDVFSTMALLIVAGVLGDGVNYHIGQWLGPRVFASETSWLLNKKHLMHTQRFYEKYGGKTIIFARFIPIVRTFAPFVAGIGVMNYGKFLIYNVIGAVAWVVVCTMAGYFFGGISWVKENFSLVVLGIIFVSVLPMLIEMLIAWRRGRAAAVPAVTNPPTPAPLVRS
jgi:membrane-associated protein